MFGIQEGITEITVPVYFVFSLWLLVIRKRKHSGLSLQHEDEEDANRESGGSSSEKEDAAADQEKGVESEDAKEKEEEEMLASSVSDIEPKSEVPPSTQVKVS